MKSYQTILTFGCNFFTLFWRQLDSSRFKAIQLIFLTLTTVLHQIMSKPLNYATSSHHRSSSSISSHSPHRISPCNLPFYFIPSKTSLPEPYEKVYRRAKAMKGCAERIRRNFVQMLGDEDFESGLDSLRHSWLPEISNSIEDIATIEEEDAFRRSFQYLQYFAIGLEQLLLDQALHEGQMIKEFREIEDKLSQLLCEIQLGMWYRNIKPDKHIEFEVMTQEYRDIADASRRMIRDYLLLRDLVKLTDYITQIFASLASRF
ncbi:uncharacterized protein LOC107365317 [Tetranychus urticae]|uniref:uncharacterized protein LOC107365317 n=1 Tax=Tetranychus urticae TaxID=32264 RepID=UPI00077BFBCC|nr:uncharacterized protein LOC107365317 [Tetranychus urticae]